MVKSSDMATQPKILSFALRKGGVCRTTSVFNISYAAALSGLRVLMVDLDSQHNLTTISSRPPEGAPTVYDVLADGADLTKAMLPTTNENLFLVPGDSEMSSLDFALGEVPPEVRFQILKRWFARSEGLKDFDLVTIDMGPSMNGAMINALAASTHFISPIRCDPDSLDGLNQLFEEMAKEITDENPDLQFLGAFLVDYNSSKTVAKSVEKTLRNKLEETAFETRIRTNTNFQKARAVQKSIFEFEPVVPNPEKTKGRDDVMALTGEIIERLGLTARTSNQSMKRAANE